MKKFASLVFAAALTLSLASCGQTENPDTSTTDTTEAVTAVDKKESTTNKQGFFHFSHGFSDKWKIDKDRSTDVCLCADYPLNDDSAAALILSVSRYDDGGGAGKSESLASSVKKREASSADVFEKTIGGITFYGVCFDSYEHDGKRLCNMFGQTDALSDGSYYFLDISIDNMPSDGLLSEIEKDLQTIKFSF